MKDKTALLNAIKAHEAEDTPRLVFADWLEENDRPGRAEFVRSHVATGRAEQQARKTYIDLTDAREKIEASPDATPLEAAQKAYDQAMANLAVAEAHTLEVLRKHPEVSAEILAALHVTHPRITEVGDPTSGNGWVETEQLFNAISAHDGEITAESPFAQNLFQTHDPNYHHSEGLLDYRAAGEDPARDQRSAFMTLGYYLKRGFLHEASLWAPEALVEFTPTVQQQIQALNATEEPINTLNISSPPPGISTADLASITLSGLTTLSLYQASNQVFEAVGTNPAFATLRHLTVTGTELSPESAHEFVRGNLPVLQTLHLGFATIEAGSMRTLVESHMCRNVRIDVPPEAVFNDPEESKLLLAHNHLVTLEARQEQAALLAAIRAEPENDKHRLAYADWLEIGWMGGHNLEEYKRYEKSNNARAEFIRLQIERSHAEVNDPRRQELKAREDKLLEEFGVEWAKNDLGRFAAQYYRSENSVGLLGPDLKEMLESHPNSLGHGGPALAFRRGFVDSIVLPDSNVATAYVPDLLKETPVTSLHFSGMNNGYRWLSHMGRGSYGGDLTLDARWVGGTQIGLLHCVEPGTPQARALLGKLQHLSLGGHDPKRLATELEQFPTLKPKTLELYTEETQIGAGDDAELIAGYRRLMDSPNLKDTFVFQTHLGFKQDKLCSGVPTELANICKAHNDGLSESIERDAVKYAVDKGVLPFAVPAPEGVEADSVVGTLTTRTPPRYPGTD